MKQQRHSTSGSTRRSFLKDASVLAAAAIVSPDKAEPQSTPAGTVKRTVPLPGIDVVRRPDKIFARFATKEVVSLKYGHQAWTYSQVRVTAEPERSSGRAAGVLPVHVLSESQTLTYLHLRWEGRQRDDTKAIGDAWERSYGDLEWRCTVPNRVMPWYFLSMQSDVVNGYGVKTGPAAFCFWQSDSDGITLTIDLRNGGEAATLGGRDLLACTVVTRGGTPGQTVVQVSSDLCKAMCEAPRLPAFPLFGTNDWNYAYGTNTANGILRDADLIRSLTPSAGNSKPYVVIDDGYQDRARFPDMRALAADLRKRDVRPGLWIRPLRAGSSAQASLLLPPTRFGPSTVAPAYDPTIPEALQCIRETVKTAVDWGYEFIKHDFSTFELFGRWGFEMEGGPARAGWRFHDPTKTSAEIVSGLYRELRSAAGEQTVVLGCNTVGHLAAGIFDSQRIADDTSGREWERTRRNGVNGLAHRIAQHRTFSYIDPDCVAVTRAIPWTDTKQWLDVVSRSGSALFLSPEPGVATAEMLSAMKDAVALVLENAGGYPSNPLDSTTPAEWTFTKPDTTSRRYDWSGEQGASAFLVT